MADAEKGVKSTVEKEPVEREPKKVARDDSNTTKDDDTDIKDLKKV